MRGRLVWTWGVGLLVVCAGLAPALVTGVPPAAASGGAGLQGNGSVDEAWLTGATPGDAITLLQNGTPVVNAANPGTADSLGSLIIRDLAPGTGYSWDDTTVGEQTPMFSVLAPGDNPATDSALYTNQPMHAGLNYLTMRDGIQLAATVRYPYGTTCSASAPCPTVIEYSGYGVAGPTDPIPYLLAQVAGTTCTGCGDPNLLPDSSTEVGAVLARVVGFATVSLQMRGTGCSGGAYDLFGYPSDYDAYDAIEIVAHQNWVANHKVGMVGISYSGLSQLPSAGTDPPGLAAIAPMSPTDDLFSTGYPGGIYNDGFAASWIADRIDDAKAAATWMGGQLAPLSSTPVSGVGQPWTYYEIEAELAASGGSSSPCLANQALHGQSESLASLVGPQLVAPGTGSGRDPALFDRRSIRAWATHITVPVFISGALEDDQTGPQWPVLLDALPTSTRVYANMVNGGHIDSTDPQIISRWLEFLDIYVADKVPSNPSGLAAIVLDEIHQLRLWHLRPGTPARSPLLHGQDAVQGPGGLRQEDAAGGGPLRQRGRAGGGRRPPVDVLGRVQDLAAEGQGPHLLLRLRGVTGHEGTQDVGPRVVRPGPPARPLTDLPSGNVWAADPPWDWTTVPAADGVAFQTAPFTRDTTFVGPATVDLWVESAAPVEDYQVTVTEVRPSASQEEYVTSGFLRSSNQVDLADSTSLFTDPSYLASDARTLSPGSYRLVRVPVDPIAHTFRPGTELRIVISAPGGDRPSWEFDTLDSGQSATVGIGGVAASKLVVNKVSGVKSDAALPTCGSLRGEPCRAFQAEGNQGPSSGSAMPSVSASSHHGAGPKGRRTGRG